MIITQIKKYNFSFVSNFSVNRENIIFSNKMKPTKNSEIK